MIRTSIKVLCIKISTLRILYAYSLITLMIPCVHQPPLIVPSMIVAVEGALTDRLS